MLLFRFDNIFWSLLVEMKLFLLELNMLNVDWRVFVKDEEVGSFFFKFIFNVIFLIWMELEFRLMNFWRLILLLLLVFVFFIICFKFVLFILFLIEWSIVFNLVFEIFLLLFRLNNLNVFFKFFISWGGRLFLLVCGFFLLLIFLILGWFVFDKVILFIKFYI